MQNTVRRGFAILRFAIVLVTTATSATAASATTITDWAFEIDNGFTAFAPASVTGSINNAFLTNPANFPYPLSGGGTLSTAFSAAPTLLSWGDSMGTSSLSVGSATNGFFSGSLSTDGPAVNTLTVTHHNESVPLGSTLTSATLTDVLRLVPTAPNPPYDGSTTLSLPALMFAVNFDETPNTAPCVDTSSPPSKPCNDIFVINVTGAGFNSADDSFNQAFLFDGTLYNIKILLTGLTTLTDAECTAAGAAIGCIGFTTIENQDNNFQASLQITTLPFAVPEPASLALISLGIGGIAVARRRRQCNG